MNCYNCRYRFSVPGSAHSKCDHQNTKDIHNDPMIEMLGIFASVGRVSPIIFISKVAEVATKTGITLNMHGVMNNWANWPIDYDPVWIDSCNGFEEKEKK